MVTMFFVLRLINSTRDIAKKLHYVFRIFPPFAFGYGLMNLGK